MTRNSRLTRCVAPLMLLLCTALGSDKKPETLKPVIVQKAYAATYDAAWAATLAACRELNGEPRFAGKESQLIFFSLSRPQERERYYFNVYVEPLRDQGIVLVYLVTHTWNGRYISEIENEFFGQLGITLKEAADAPR